MQHTADAGHLRNSNLDIIKVYEANIVDNVVYSYSNLAQHGRHDTTMADFTIAVLEGAAVHLKLPTPPGTNVAWIHNAVSALLTCFCEFLQSCRLTASTLLYSPVVRDALLLTHKQQACGNVSTMQEQSWATYRTPLPHLLRHGDAPFSCIHACLPRVDSSWWRHSVWHRSSL